VVLRRAWAECAGIWDSSLVTSGEHVIFNGQEIIFGVRLVLAGCQFGNVGRALNYRRFYSGRHHNRLAERCQNELKCLAMVLADPRCPAEVGAQRATAAARLYLDWAYVALIQGERALGHEYIEAALQLTPGLAQGKPPALVQIWVDWVAHDAVQVGISPDETLTATIGSLPAGLVGGAEHLDQARSRAYLLAGLEATLWPAILNPSLVLAQAVQLGAQVDEATAQAGVSSLLAFETEFGEAAGQDALQQWVASLRQLGLGPGARQLEKHYWMNRASRCQRRGQSRNLLSSVWHALRADPRLVANRGVLSMAGRALAQAARSPSVTPSN
jgi:hypothetical protein